MKIGPLEIRKLKNDKYSDYWLERTDGELAGEGMGIKEDKLIDAITKWWAKEF